MWLLFRQSVQLVLVTCHQEGKNVGDILNAAIKSIRFKPIKGRHNYKCACTTKNVDFTWLLVIMLFMGKRLILIYYRHPHKTIGTLGSKEDPPFFIGKDNSHSSLMCNSTFIQKYTRLCICSLRVRKKSQEVREILSSAIHELILLFRIAAVS